MARPVTLPFGSYLILVGDGNSPETFVAPCGLTTKGASRTANTQDTIVPDCDDPDAPAYIERAVDSLSLEVSGSGVLAIGADGDAFWDAWFDSALYRNVRIVMPHKYIEGRFILTAYNDAVQRGQKVNVDITMLSDGEWTTTTGAPPSP